MKTSKAKTTSTPKKTSGVGQVIKSKIVTPGKSLPSQEEIRKKAYEIYNQRINQGKFGTESDDWSEAEKLLTSS